MLDPEERSWKGGWGVVLLPEVTDMVEKIQVIFKLLTKIHFTGTMTSTGVLVLILLMYNMCTFKKH